MRSTTDHARTRDLASKINRLRHAQEDQKLAEIQQAHESTNDQELAIVVQYIKGGDEVTCVVNDTDLTFLIDSGCSVNLIRRQALQLSEARCWKMLFLARRSLHAYMRGLGGKVE